MEGVGRRVILKIPVGILPDSDDVLVQVQEKDNELILEVEDDEGHNSGKLETCGKTFAFQVLDADDDDFDNALAQRLPRPSFYV